jgi:hypothetical protein
MDEIRPDLLFSQELLIGQPLGNRRCDHRASGVVYRKSCGLVAGRAVLAQPKRRVGVLAGLDVVVQRKLVRGRPEVYRRNLEVTLKLNPRLDQVGRENAALGEVFAVFL